MKRIIALTLLLIPSLFSCEEMLSDKPLPCKESVYEKDRYPKVECKHAQHQLIDQDKYWLCKCAPPGAPSASASASASAAVSAAPEQQPPKPAKKEEDDYSWLDP